MLGACVRSRPGARRAVVRMPDELFHRQPAHALDEAALDLADVDRRVERPAGVVQDVRGEQLPFAGERVDDDLAHRRAVGEVVERPALHRLAVPRQARRRVEAVGPELDARHVGVDDELAERDRLLRADRDRAAGEATRSRAPCARRRAAGAKATRRALIWRAASSAALPFRSLPVDAAVADVLATFCVSVAVTRTAPMSTPSSCATTCATLVLSPWPISVPPWLTSTEPSP